MKVTNISASVRYSKSLELGEHKTVELSAEASLEPDDDWHQAQQGLYASLTTQLRTLWSKNGIAEHVRDGPRMAVQPSSWEELEERANALTKQSLVLRASDRIQKVHERG